MRTALLSATACLCLAFASFAQAQTPPKAGDTRIESAPLGSAPGGDVLSKTPESKPAAEGSKGDGVTTGKDGDPIGATNDDKGRQGEAHSDPTLATKPAPPSDPKFQ